MVGSPLPVIAVLGASGLIGQAVAMELQGAGFPVVAVARRFSRAQRAAFRRIAGAPFVDFDPSALAGLLAERRVDIVVNCVGVLQDSRRSGSTDDVHRGFVARLVTAMDSPVAPRLLVHLSIPGREAEDGTAFSRSKREAERVIRSGKVPFVIVRPGFVVAPAAYGGSALLRALGVLPFELPEREASSPFASTDVADIARTISTVARRWSEGERDWHAAWDVMERRSKTVGEVIAAFRHRLGGPERRLRLPAWSMRLGAKAGDLSAYLGWAPPIRTTALAEMRRGVCGDPEPWIVATGIEPTSLADTLSRMPASVQERWFARLYLLKAAIFATLSLFWIASGLVALTVAFDAASAILVAHGFPASIAPTVTAVTSLADIVVGVSIAVRRLCRGGLLAGLAVSLLYMASATVVSPEMWFDPLGSLVKIGPAIVLMLVALAILDER